jgi:hypothetical protein
MKGRTPTSAQLDELRGVGATTPIFLAATDHPGRSAPFVLTLAMPFVFGLALSLYALTDDATGWPWKLGVLAFTAILGYWMVRGFRQGIVIDRGRIGMRHPLRPGTVWVELDQVDLAIPLIHMGYNIRGARRRGRHYYGPAGSYTTLTLWSRAQGSSRWMTWLTRVQLIPRQRRFVTDHEARLGGLRVLRIDSSHFEVSSNAAILIHLLAQLPPRQAEQLQDVDEYAALLNAWAHHCYVADGPHRTDWRRDPRTLDTADLGYGPGFA